MLVGYWIRLNCLLQKAVEQKAASSGSSAIETKRELVQVVVQMLATHASLMGSHQPSLEQGRHEMNSR
jgi:hypothetical protein